MDTPGGFELIRRAPPSRLAGLVSGMTGYRETAPGQHYQRETATLVVPLIVSFGTPFLIGLGRPPTAGDEQSAFAAGLFAGPVHILSDGGAECVQVDFTPLGAYRFFGGAVTAMTARMIPIDDLLEGDDRDLRNRLGETLCWQRRLDVLEGLIERRTLGGRAGSDPAAEIVHAWHRLEQTGGTLRIADLADDIGWSRKHLVTRFKAHIGLGPKTVARMIRFNRACRLASGDPGIGWAGIAADCGYNDQAHLIREFTDLAGETPTAWARRSALAGGRPNPDPPDRIDVPW